MDDINQLGEVGEFARFDAIRVMSIRRQRCLSSDIAGGKKAQYD